MSDANPKFSECDMDLSLMPWNFDAWGYARRTINHPMSGGKRKIECRYAHQDVALRMFGRKPTKADRECVDHINRDKLDNRRENLRIVSYSQNNRNVKRKCVGGIFNRGGRWTVHLRGQYICQFKTPKEAELMIGRLRSALGKVAND